MLCVWYMRVVGREDAYLIGSNILYSLNCKQSTKTNPELRKGTYFKIHNFTCTYKDILCKELNLENFRTCSCTLRTYLKVWMRPCFFVPLSGTESIVVNGYLSVKDHGRCGLCYVFHAELNYVISNVLRFLRVIKSHTSPLYFGTWSREASWMNFLWQIALKAAVWRGQ